MNEETTFKIAAVVGHFFYIHLKPYYPSGVLPRKEWKELFQITKHVLLCHIGCQGSHIQSLIWSSENLSFFTLTDWREIPGLAPPPISVLW